MAKTWFVCKYSRKKKRESPAGSGEKMRKTWKQRCSQQQLTLREQQKTAKKT
jgi:hypothetical protein